MKIIKLGALLTCLYAASVNATDFGHLTVFGELAYSDATQGSTRSEADIQPSISADILYTFDYKRFSLLAEYYLNEDDSELERLELGLQLTSWSSIKAGLLHNPAEYWLSEYHRGSYSQSSVTKPFQSLIGFPGGITSQQLSGVQWKNEFTLPNDNRLQIDYTAAASPDLSIEEPKAEVDDFFSRDGELNLSIISLRYTPFTLNDSSIGASYINSDVGFDRNSLDLLLGPLSGVLASGHAHQKAFNVYMNIETGTWRILLSHFDEEIELESSNPLVGNLIGNDLDTRFTLDYLHLEKTFKEKLLVFGRYEKATPKEDISTFSQLVAPFLDFDLNYEKSIVGARWDFANRQAVTVQYSDHSTPRSKQNMVHLTWSFVWDVGL